MKLQHKALIDLLKMAYSAEKAAAFAYIGHANSLKESMAIASINQIEQDEWEHRKEVLKIMQQYEIPISKYYELKFHIIGKFIAFSCHIIGWFMPYYFAGSLESGNVCEYIKMIQYFHEIGITEHDKVLYEMAIKEKEHEVFFLKQVQGKRILLFFEKLFFWGRKESFNDVDLAKKKAITEADLYCKK